MVPLRQRRFVLSIRTVERVLSQSTERLWLVWLSVSATWWGWWGGSKGKVKVKVAQSVTHSLKVSRMFVSGPCGHQDLARGLQAETNADKDMEQLQ